MFFLTSGYRMYYEWSPHHDVTARTIVLIHGAGLSSALWRPILPFLSCNYSILTFDMAGHGQSEADRSPPSFESTAHDLHLLLQSLSLSRVILAAHDTGAAVAERFAALFHMEVDCIVMLAPVWPLPLASVQQLVRAKLGQLELTGNMQEFAYTQLPALTASATDSWLSEEVVGAFARVSKRLYKQTIESAAFGSTGPMPVAFHKPLLLIAGEQDPGFPPALAHVISKLLDGTSLLIVPDSSNLVFADQPFYTADFINRFINRQKAGDPRKPSPVELEMNAMFRSYWEHSISPAASRRHSIRIRCIGQFEVTVGNRVQQQGWNTRHAKSLMIYLAFHRSATREQICDALFSDTDFHRAMNNLRVYLSHFAKLLESEDVDFPCLTIERDMVKLNYEVDCDLSSLLKQLQLALDMEDNAYRYSMCQLLLEKLQGKMLPGCYDPFSLQLTETVEQLWESLSLWAADYACRQELYAEAVSFLQSGLQYSTGDELLFYDRLIVIYVRTGNRKEQRKWMRIREKMLRSE
ncbi:alpha/beta fold hydrolase [Paenibacillus filicis]|uniref:Alpha/beta fold hydrolase n=1 Tax=Paenibacillus filicis TaxID=669464 RepID=A0ABU9DDK0_9BACL